MTTHLPEHPHAFLDDSNVVTQIAAFSEESHNSELLDTLKVEHEHAKVVCCCTFGLPYIGDTWDDVNKKWIETVPRIVPIQEEPIE